MMDSDEADSTLSPADQLLDVVPGSAFNFTCNEDENKDKDHRNLSALLSPDSEEDEYEDEGENLAALLSTDDEEEDEVDNEKENEPIQHDRIPGRAEQVLSIDLDALH